MVDSGDDSALPLAGIRVLSLAVNLPGPAAAARLCRLGADVTKVEPPAGDPLKALVPAYYDALADGQHVVELDLKNAGGRDELWRLLGRADLLLTSSRPSALARLGLDWVTVHRRLPRLCVVSIVGQPGAQAEVAGHDLTYQAGVGALTPPQMPRLLVADLAGAERAVADGLAALLARARTGVAVRREVALSEVMTDLAAPIRHELTTPGGPLAGGWPQYGIYPAADGYVAIAALEPHFWSRLTDLLGTDGSRDGLIETLRRRSAGDWEQWATAHDLPLAAVRPPSAGTV